MQNKISDGIRIEQGRSVLEDENPQDKRSGKQYDEGQVIGEKRKNFWPNCDLSGMILR
jgi:hypothetical protein